LISDLLLNVLISDLIHVTHFKNQVTLNTYMLRL
jgi:hypothetical protein